VLLWVAAVVFAPLAITSRVSAIARAAALVYATGSLVCHQRPDRSFHIHGHQLAVCARCTGLYVSALAGGVLALALGVTSISSSRARLWLGAAAVPTLLTVGLELAGFAYPSNTVRMLSALPLGAVAALLLMGVLHGAPSTSTEHPAPSTEHPAPST
jgi:uncharacterized membrane protein